MLNGGIIHHSRFAVTDTTAHVDRRLVYEVPEAGEMLGLNRNAAYAAAKRGDIPTIRIGKLIRVPKAAFNLMLERAGAK
jgi:excisionase family DNA binding protein